MAIFCDNAPSAPEYVNFFLLYTHIIKYIYIHINMIMQDAINKDAVIKTFTSHFIARVRKGCSRVACESELETEHKLIFWPQCYDRHVVSFLFSWYTTGGLGSHSAVWWLSLLHLISIFSGPQLIRAPGPFGLVWLSLPHLISTGTWTLWLELNCQLPLPLPIASTSILTVLYNSSTPTQSPTRSLKSNI